MKRALLVILSLILVCSCSSEDLNRPAMDQALSTAQSKVPSRGKTEMTLPYADLGEHVAEVSLNFFVRTAAGFRHRVVVDRRIYRGGDGAFRIVDDRSWTDPEVSPRGTDDGRELLFNGQRFVTRRKWGPWMERPFWRGEHNLELTRGYDVVPTVLEMFKGHLSSLPGSTETIMRKQARWENLSLNTTPAEPSSGKGTGGAKEADRFHEKRLGRWFEATHHPETVNGRIARRVDNGEIVRAELILKGRAKVRREDAEFELSVSFNLMPIGKDVGFAIPDEVLPSARERTWTMITDVLGDSLRAVYRSTSTGTQGR